MKPKHFSHLVILASSLVILTSCSNLQLKDENKRSLDIQTSLEKHQEWHNASEQPNAESTLQNSDTKSEIKYLYELIEIPELKSLIEHGLTNNPSLKSTLLALEVVKSQKQQVHGDRLPSANFNLGYAQAEDSDDVFSSNLSISWELDVWAKLSDQVKAAEQDIIVSAYDLQAAQDTLAANIMRTWLGGSYYSQLIEIEQKRLNLLENNETLIKQRYRAGLGSLEELDSARTETASTRATIVSYKENLKQSKRSLARLIGVHESDYPLNISQQFPKVLMPLTSLPAQDLARRPDLKKYYANIQATQHRTSVAYKDLLPSLNLEAALTDSAENLRDALFVSPVWSLLSQLTLPLFQGGKLRAARDIADFKAEQAYWDYQSALLTAIEETENALSQENTLALEIKHIQEALKSAQNSSEFYKNKYKEGLVDILDLLQVQQQTFNLETQLLQATFNQLTNRIDLGLALGLPSKVGV